MISDIEGRIIVAANDLRLRGVSKGTLQANDIQSAVRMMLTDKLCQVAVSEGTKMTLKPDLLLFSAARAGHHLRASARMHVSHLAPVYLTAVLGYLITEIIQIALEEKHKDDPGAVTLTPAHLNRAIRKDECMNQCFRGVVARGGVAAEMMKDVMSPKKSKKRSR